MQGFEIGIAAAAMARDRGTSPDPFAQLTAGSSCAMMRAWKKLFTRAVRAK